MNAFPSSFAALRIKRGTRLRSAFTLIELLTVIAIIGVLASLVIVSTARVRETARSAHCTSNLRQIGVALQLYVNEHGGLYPGPLYTVQGPHFSGDPDGTSGLINLARRLSPYTPTFIRDGAQRRNLVFLCPSWERVMEGVPNANYPYMLNLDPRWPDGTKWNTARQPFGDANNSRPASRANEFNHCPVAQTWMLTELDRQNSSRADPMPEAPVHGSHRNVLFYDYHIGRKAIQ